MTLPDLMFKPLKEDEQIVYRDWARKHYQAGTDVNPCWHPVVRAECEQMNAEQVDTHDFEPVEIPEDWYMQDNGGI